MGFVVSENDQVGLYIIQVDIIFVFLYFSQTNKPVCLVMAYGLLLL